MRTLRRKAAGLPCMLRRNRAIASMVEALLAQGADVNAARSK